MILYYQSVENNEQKWLTTAEAQEDEIRITTAYHMSIYKLDPDKPPEETRYKGDLWFDIDHKPEAESPSQAEYQKAIKAAILDVRRLLSYFESIGLNPQQCRLFASGGKGFHVCVDASVFEATSPVINLPKLHKYMAKMIKERAGITGLDMATYCMGQGKLLRVENKKRANGKYKVPISYAELLLMTPESYAALTSAPRVEQGTMSPQVCPELSLLYLEATDALASTENLEFSATPSAQMDVFADGDHPTCVNWLVEGVNVKLGDGKFNGAKMSLARYLMNAPLTDGERNSLIDAFANSWSSHRCPTVDARRAAVKETLDFGRANCFSCSLMTTMLSERPCYGCKLQALQRQEIAKKSALEITPSGYYRPAVGKGADTPLSTFTLQAKVWYINKGDSINTFTSLDCNILQLRESGEAQVTGVINLDNMAFQSNSGFKTQVAKVANSAWYGSDIDLQHIKLLLTNEVARNGARLVENIDTIGVCRHQDAERGIDEFVWVEEAYSVNTSGYRDTLKFKGIQTTTTETRTVHLSEVAPYVGTNEEQSETLRNLLQVNLPDVVAPTLGWVIGCWLRAHIRSSETTNKHLPALQIYGSSGHGKTETATLFSLLAGADFVHSEPLVVSSCSPFAIKCEASISTTVPRIFDEMNEHRVVDRARYTQAYEAVKSSARAGKMESGTVSKDKGLGLDNRIASSPLIMLATQLNSKAEIQERTIPVSINNSKRDESHAVAFRQARNNPQHLIAVARAAMETTLELDMAWVVEALARCHEEMPPKLQNRIGVNWEFALLGLEYFSVILTRQAAPQDILDSVSGLRGFLLNYLFVNEVELSSASDIQEVDSVIDTFGEIVVQDAGSRNRKFIHGEHYFVIGDTLHIWSAVFFPQYLWPGQPHIN